MFRVRARAGAWPNCGSRGCHGGRVSRGRVAGYLQAPSEVRAPAMRWRRGRDSNPRNPVRGLTVFETAPFNRSGTSPLPCLHELTGFVQAGGEILATDCGPDSPLCHVQTEDSNQRPTSAPVRFLVPVPYPVERDGPLLLLAIFSSGSSDVTRTESSPTVRSLPTPDCPHRAVCSVPSIDM